MFDTPTILKKAAEKGGFIRTRYQESDVPTSLSSVSIMALFGDMRTMFISSSLLLKRYREEIKGSKYFILFSWPGYEGFFPYVDEFWTLQDENALLRLKDGIDNFKNTSDFYVLSQRHLNHYFEDNIDSNVLSLYYKRGLTQEFFDRFGNTRCFLPTISSAVAVGTEFNRAINTRHGFKVFIYPQRTIKGWVHNQEKDIRIGKEFWIELCKKLVKEGFCPVVYRDVFAYDLSPDLTTECIHLGQQPISKLLGAMRATGCVLDIFSGISRLAVAARCPYLMIDERARYVGLKEYEIDDLCAINLPKDYIFGFSTIIESGDLAVWSLNIYNSIVARLNDFAGRIDYDNLPSTSESNEIVSYDQVRKSKTRRLGTRFIKVNRD